MRIGWLPHRSGKRRPPGGEAWSISVGRQRRLLCFSSSYCCFSSIPPFERTLNPPCLDVSLPSLLCFPSSFAFDPLLHFFVLIPRLTAIAPRAKMRGAGSVALGIAWSPVCQSASAPVLTAPDSRVEGGAALENSALSAGLAWLGCVGPAETSSHPHRRV